MSTLDQIDTPAAYLMALASGVVRECGTCGQDMVPVERNVYDGGHQIACDDCLTRAPGYYVGDGMDPSPAMQEHVAGLLIRSAALAFLHGEDPADLDLAILADALGVDRSDVAALSV